MSSSIRQAWFRWKALRLPWRKRFYVGQDLSGNQFWEFRDTYAEPTSSLSSSSSPSSPSSSSPSPPKQRQRMRRIVSTPSATHLSDVVIPPQWHQWLRHTRLHPPSLAELRADVARRQNIRRLAEQADARWERKERLAGPPVRERPTAQMDPWEQAGGARAARDWQPGTWDGAAGADGLSKR